MDDFKHLSLIDMSTLLYERGFSARHLIQLVYDDPILHLCYYKLKTEFRCEKMLMFYLLYWQSGQRAELTQKVASLSDEKRSTQSMKNMLLV